MDPSSAQEFASKVYDYVVVGGGNAGLPLAARLTENPEVSVAVLEAGRIIEDDPILEVPRFVGRASGNPKYDYAFKTVPQEHATNRVVPAPRGKMLGGSTGINYMVWDRASKAEYDAWATLQDSADAWTFDALLPYFTKAEDARAIRDVADPYPTISTAENVKRLGLTKGTIGTDGPVKTSYGSEYSDIVAPFIKSWNAIGIPTNGNADGGDASGLYNLRRSVDNDTGKRINAAVAYFKPVSKRQNLKVLLGAQATKLLFDSERSKEGNAVAKGVEFVVDGKVFTIEARKEVILSAGVVQTPQLLELSGIGNTRLLRNVGVESIVDLPAVGENLQDHIFAPIQFLVQPGVKTFDLYRNKPDFLAEQEALYEATGKGWFTAIDTTAVYVPYGTSVSHATYEMSIATLKFRIAEAKAKRELTPLQEAQYAIQIGWLEEQKGIDAQVLREGLARPPDLETIFFSKGIVAPKEGDSYFVMLTGIQHPFSRGSIHINSLDPLAAPTLDPKYLSNDFDLDLLVAGYRQMEKVAATEPLKSIIQGQSVPPATLTDDEAVKGFIRQAFSSGSHLMGTCAVAKRELGGVVDNRLRVYGTSNIRVVDASIIPLPIAAHIQATVYAIAERAADLIKRDSASVSL